MSDFFSEPVFLQLTRFDMCALGLCALFGVRGFIRGLVRDAVFVGGLALAVVAARAAGPGAAVVFAPFTGPELAPFAASAFVFFVITTAAGVAAFIARKAVRLARLTWLDRALGCVLGVCSVLVILGMAAGLAARHAPEAGALLQQSPVARLSIEAMRRVMGA